MKQSASWIFTRTSTMVFWLDDQFPKVIEEVISDVKIGKLQLIDIVKLFGYFSYFCRRELIKYDINTIKGIFMNGMKLSAQKSSYCDNIEEELSRIGIDYGEDKEMDEVLQYFHKLNDMLEQKMYENKADNIFKCIPMRMEEFYDSFAKECMNRSILNYYDPYKMFQRIMCASNEDIVLIKEMLVDRAKKNTELIKPELSFTIRLKKIIDDYYKEREINIKMVMLKEFSNDLQTIINLYDEDSINNALNQTTENFIEDDEFEEVNFDV